MSGGRVCRTGHSGGGGCEQLSGGVKQSKVFEGCAVEAEGGVVKPRRDCRTAWRANGAEVWSVLVPFAHRRHFPGLREETRGGFARGGGGQVVAAFYGGLEGELPIRAALLMLVLDHLSISHVLESRSIRGDARVEEIIIRAQEDGLLIQRANQALFTPRAAGLSLGKGFRSLAFNGNKQRLVLQIHLEVFAALRLRCHSWSVTLCHLSDIQHTRCTLQFHHYCVSNHIVMHVKCEYLRGYSHSLGSMWREVSLLWAGGGELGRWGRQVDGGGDGELDRQQVGVGSRKKRFHPPLWM